MPTQEHLVLLAEVAMLYYQKGMTQGQIAAILDVSRSTVSRLLDEALLEKVVEITVHFPWQSSVELSARLEERFHLGSARVLAEVPDDEERVLAGLGALAARYLTACLRDDSVIGVSWGRAIHQTIKALRVTPGPRRQAVQIVGVGDQLDPAHDASGLVQLLADTVGGTAHPLHAPRVVDDKSALQALLRDHGIQETLRLARAADILLVTVRGTAALADLPGPNAGGAPTDARQPEPGEPVGEICGQVFDILGRPLDIAGNRRVVGIDLACLKSHHHVVAVAGGRRHVPAILGALRGQFVQVLITDERTAQALLDLDR